MNTLFVNINGVDIKSTNSLTVVGKPEDAIINKFYYEFGKRIKKDIFVPYINDVQNINLVADFEACDEDAFAHIMEQWDLVKQMLLGEEPTGTFKVTLPQEYVEWLNNHSNCLYNKIALGLTQKGNVVEINIDKIYRNGIGALLKAIPQGDFDRFVVNDNNVGDDSAIAEAIRKKIGDDVPFVPFSEFATLNVDASNEEDVDVENSNDAIFVVNGVEFVMKPVEGGSFMMGSDAYDDEKPVHRVTVNSYYIGETVVTQALWNAVMGDNPSRFRGDNLPVEQVNWYDCQDFIRELNKITGKSFRLPTEAEWEFAARGGRLSEGYQYSGSDDIDDVAWCDDNSGFKTHEVKGKQPNELGLYDMSGNVWEWCNDRYGSDYYSNSPSTTPHGLSSGLYRVQRGSSCNFSAWDCQVSLRRHESPDIKYSDYGFRLCLSQ